MLKLSVILSKSIRKVNSFGYSMISPKRLIVFAGQGTQEINMLNSLLDIPQAKSDIENYSH